MLTYLVVVVGFYLSGFSGETDPMGINRFDALPFGQETFKTIGRTRSGRAY